MNANTINAIWKFATYGIILLVPLSFFSGQLLRYAWIAIAIAYGTTTFSAVGRPQFSKIWLSQALQFDNTHYFMLGLFGWMTSLTALIMISSWIYAGVHVINLAKTSYPQHDKLQSIHRQVVANTNSIQQMAAQWEVCMAFVLLAKLLPFIGGGGSFFALFFYIQFLQMRYCANSVSQSVMNEMGRSFDAWVYGATFIPGFVKTAYRWVREFLARSIRPPQAAQQQATQ